MNKNIATTMALMFSSMLNQTRGVLLALDSDDSRAERTRLENAISALESLVKLYCDEVKWSDE